MTIIAKETFSNGIVSMFKGEIREITEGDPEYTALLSEGLVEEYSAGGGGGAEVIGVTWSKNPQNPEQYTVSINKTCAELYALLRTGKRVIIDASSENEPKYAEIISYNYLEESESKSYTFVIPWFVPSQYTYWLTQFTGSGDNINPQFSTV